MLELRSLLKEPDLQERFNALHKNAFRFDKFTKKLSGIRERVMKSRLFQNTVDAMKNIFSSVDNHIVREITKGFRKEKFPIPELALDVRPESLDAFIETNVNLIGTIVDKQSEALENSVKKAVQGGSNFSIVVAEVESQADNGRSYAEFVARDQVGKTYAAINKERQEAVGFDKYTWNATNDSRTRATHRALDGQVFSWDAPPSIDGKNLHPGEDFQCRCVAVPTF